MAYNKEKQHKAYLKYYYKDIERSRESSRKRVNKNAARNKKAIQEYKASHPCIKCGESDPIVLEFHHRDRIAKTFTVAHRLNRISIQTALDEIAKCDVLCANCHRRITSLNKHYSQGRKRIKECPTTER